MLLTLTTMSLAWSLEFAPIEPMVAGQTVAIEAEGALAGERVYLVVGRTPETDGLCPPTSGPCADIGRSWVLRSGFADAQGHIVFDVPLPSTARPGRFLLQVVSTTAKSAVWGDLANDPGPIEVGFTSGGVPPLTFTGIQATCTAGGDAELLSEYIGAADELVATGYRDGAAAIRVPLTTLPASAGAVFFFASGSAPVSDCASLTWAYEALSIDEEDCVVDGPEEQTLVDEGAVGQACRTW